MCTACGGLRPPLSSPSINFAGKPARVGGAVASAVAGFILLVGISLSLGIALLFTALDAATVGFAIALPIALVSSVLGAVLLRRGSSLRRAGAVAERGAREQALLELAAHRGGVTADEAARALGVGPAEADAMLTDLAKREPDRVAVDVDDGGVLRYRPVQVAADMRVRVGEPPISDNATGQEGDDEIWKALEQKKGAR
jgi:hypothetical protein